MLAFPEKIIHLISINVLFYSLEVLATLTSDVGKILASLHRVQSKGEINFLTAVKIAHVGAKEVENEIYSMNEFVRCLKFHFLFTILLLFDVKRYSEAWFKWIHQWEVTLFYQIFD